MTISVKTTEYTLNGTLVPASVPQTRNERIELKFLSRRIANLLTEHSSIFKVIVRNGSITVVAEPRIEGDFCLDWVVQDAINQCRPLRSISKGAYLYGSDDAVGSVFKAIRPSTMFLSAQDEADYYRIILETARDRLRNRFEAAPKQDRRSLMARNALQVSDMIRNALDV